MSHRPTTTSIAATGPAASAAGLSPVRGRRRRRRVLGTAAGVVALAFVLGACEMSPAERSMAGWVDDRRAEAGLGGLAPDADLVGLAQAWAGHVAAVGRPVHSAIGEGRLPEGWCTVGEAVGTSTAGAPDTAIREALLDSAHHRGVLLADGVDRIGVGRADATKAGLVVLVGRRC